MSVCDCSFSHAYLRRVCDTKTQDSADDEIAVIVRETGDGVGVWNRLRVMENTAALKYQWPQSRCSDLLLRAINIDARNIVSRS